ncbi:uncharacterized protein [Haliotis asinina]|uniref:uncharacterized protein n=1 Tax=Haliotis asinina TaxID=109174 RepID=UPI003532260F
MSIWSRSHRDLAKLAKDLQERNNRVKANAATRGKGAARRQASSSEIAVLREKSLAAGASQGGKSRDRTKSVRFILSDHGCLDETLTETDLSENGNHNTRKKYEQINVDKDLINYEKRQANTHVSQQILNEESKIKSTAHGKEPSEELSEEKEDENTTSNPTTEHGNSNEPLSADPSINGSKMEEKGVSRQILFLLQKDFINSSKGDRKQCLSLTELEGLLSLLLMARSEDAGDKHENMIRMVETLILKQKSLHQKQGHEQHKRDDVNHINVKKDKLPQRGLIPSKIPRKHIKKMSPCVFPETNTDNAQKYDVAISNIEKRNDVDQEHKNDEGEQYHPQNCNTTGSSEDEVTADGQHTRNVSDGIHNANGIMWSNDVGTLDVLEERSKDEQNEMKESRSVKELFPVMEKTDSVIVRCGSFIGESISTSKKLSDVTQGSGANKVSVPGECSADDSKVSGDRCIQSVLPADDVASDSSGEENQCDSGQEQDLRQISRHKKEEIQHLRDIWKENGHESKISGQELEFRQISRQEQETWGNSENDFNGEENGHSVEHGQIPKCKEHLKEHNRRISGEDGSHKTQIINCQQVMKGVCQSNSDLEENVRDSSISEQEQLMQISRYKKEWKKQSYDSEEDYSQISKYKEVTTEDCYSDSSMEKHGYDLNTTEQMLKEERQPERWKLLNSEDVSKMSLSCYGSKSSLAGDPLDYGEHMLQSPNVLSVTPVPKKTSQIDDSGTTVSSMLSVDSSFKASLADKESKLKTVPDTYRHNQSVINTKREQVYESITEQER